ncbi:MAG: hypothetical protein P4L35_06165, partial [Ignavibacteriaceae bacterium]|nr:hypothetical protein [Ignavibacteriaceae bacterium]
MLKINRLLFSSFLLVYIFMLRSGAYSQTKTNLDVFFSLVDSSVNQFLQTSNIPSKIKVDLLNGDAYSVFNSRILGDLRSKGIEPANTKTDSFPVLSYTLEKPLTQYTNIFRDGFLGTYLVQRVISIKGNYYYPGLGRKEFYFANLDTVNTDEIKSIENISFKFTSATLPPEPFFSGLFEPIAALGTAAAAVILFFT